MGRVAPFRNDKPAVEAALGEAERLRKADARERRRKAILGAVGVVVVAVVVPAVSFGLYLVISALMALYGHH